jgi:hypothetical protein
LIYTSPNDYYLSEGLFLTYQNECPDCLPITDLEGVYMAEEHQVNLSWTAPETTALLGFDIFRNDILIDSLPPTTLFYSDNTSQLEPGDYKYCVVPVYPSVCTLDDACFETPINIGINNYADNILIYPNPTKNELSIEMSDMRHEISDIEIFDLFGRKQSHASRVTCHESKVDISHLQAGIYFIKITTEQGIITKKIVKH